MSKSNNSLIQFLLKQFPDEQSAVDYLVKRRWPNGPRCPYCKGSKVGGPFKGNQPFKCYPCNKKFGAKTGTFMHNSPIPVRAWLLMAHFWPKAGPGHRLCGFQASLVSPKSRPGIWVIEFAKPAPRRTT